MPVRMWSNRNSHSLLVGMQNGTATLADSFQFLTKLIILLPHDPEMVLLGIYPNELNDYIHTKTCTWIFRAALLIIAKPGGSQDVPQ